MASSYEGMREAESRRKPIIDIYQEDATTASFEGERGHQPSHLPPRGQASNHQGN